MELLETNNPKSDLLKKSMMHRKALEDEVKAITDRTEKIVTNALIVGGALALTYLIVREFTSTTRKRKSKSVKAASVAAPADEKEEKDESRLAAILTEIGTALATQATAFLLALAKEKLIEYLEHQAEKKREKE